MGGDGTWNQGALPPLNNLHYGFVLNSIIEKENNWEIWLLMLKSTIWTKFLSKEFAYLKVHVYSSIKGIHSLQGITWSKGNISVDRFSNNDHVKKRVTPLLSKRYVTLQLSSMIAFLLSSLCSKSESIFMIWAAFKKWGIKLQETEFLSAGSILIRHSVENLCICTVRFFWFRLLGRNVIPENHLTVQWAIQEPTRLGWIFLLLIDSITSMKWSIRRNERSSNQHWSDKLSASMWFMLSGKIFQIHFIFLTAICIYIHTDFPSNCFRASFQYLQVSFPRRDGFAAFKNSKCILPWWNDNITQKGLSFRNQISLVKIITHFKEVSGTIKWSNIWCCKIDLPN